jgi:Protein of unknown function (DUF4232)
MKPAHITARRTLTVAILAAAGSVIAGCGSSPPSARPTVTVTKIVRESAPATSPVPPIQTSTPAGPPGCATAALKASLGPGSGAAGSSFYPIEFTNTSGSTCSLYGYPGVSFVTAAGAQVGAAATEDPTYPRQLVTLAPGDTAHAELKVGNAQNYPASTCDPVAVSLLKIFPPNQTSALTISFAATACADTSVPILAVQTVQPGQG